MRNSRSPSVSSPRLITLFISISKIAGAITVSVGAIVLFGWVMDIIILKSVFQGFVTMKANTALAFFLSGLSLWLLHGNIARPLALRINQLCALLTLLIGLLTVTEYLFDWDLGIDQFLFRDSVSGPSPAGRMAFVTAANFAAIGLALLFIKNRIGFRLAQFLILLATFASMIALIAYIYNIKSLYAVSPYSTIALHTSIAFIVLSFGLLFSQPERGLMAIITSDTAGGVTMRRLLPAAIGIPVVVGYVRLMGERAGFYGFEFGLAIMVAFSIALLVIFIWWNSRSLYQIDINKTALENQLRQAQKLEGIGQLAGGIAHDFNNMLNVISGYGDLLQSRLRGDEQSSRFLDNILTASERAAQLTQGLLAFSRKQIINPRPVNLNELVRVIEKLLSRIIGEDIELKAKLSNKDLIAMADAGQIEQAIMNLCTNAKDAMPDGGILTIETDIIEMDSEYVKRHGFGKEGKYALLSVSDTGIGMDEKTIEKIFEPFFTTKEVGKGTGLGLAMVYGVIKQHDGYINVYSELGSGTTFKIYLPLIEAEVIDLKPVEHAVPLGGKETVLIAEDDASLRMLMREVLEKFGYTVIDAVDGEDAVRKFKENKDNIQLLILDVVMPKKNGKQVYDEIIKLRPDEKVIFSSGYTANIIQKKGILEKGIDFIQKPVSPQQLLRKVREALDK